MQRVYVIIAVNRGTIRDGDSFLFAVAQSPEHVLVSTLFLIAFGHLLYLFRDIDKFLSSYGYDQVRRSAISSVFYKQTNYP